MASTTNSVVVWEWMNEFGRWRPYEPHITNFIEKNHQLKPTNQVNLGMIDRSLAMYSIDFLTMCQVRFGTGTARPIRKRLYPDSSPPGKGIVWQWEGDVSGQWHTYDMQVACIIEDHFSKNTASPGILDLSKSAVKLPYILDLNNMSQKRIETGRVRSLRREILTVSYPMVAANQNGLSGNVGASGNSNINVPSGGSLLSNMAAQSKQIPIPSVSTNNIPCVSTNNITHSAAKKMKISHSSTAQTLSSAGQQNFPIMSSAAINQSTSNMCHTSALQNSNISGNGPLTRKRLNIYLSNQNQSLQGQPSSQNTHLFGSNIPSQPLGIPSSQMPGSMYTVSSNQMPVQSSYHSMQPTPSAGGHAQNHSLSNVNSLHPQSSSNNLMPPGTMIPPGTIMPPTSLQYLNQGGTMPPRFMFVSGGPPHMSMSQIPGHHIGLQPSVPGGGNGQAYSGSLPVPGKLFSKSKGVSRISPVVTTATSVLMSPAVPMLLPSTSASGGSNCFNLPREDRIPNNVPKNSKKDSGKSSSCDIFEKYVTIIGDPPDEDDCCICCEKLSHHSGYGEDQQDSKIVFKLCKCNHMFHKLCIQAMYESGAKNGCVQCPTCKTIYGEKHGNCPRGVMEYHWMPQSLPGNEDSQTIRIVYHVSQGIQGTEHPHPGKRFSARGFPRVCYLPDNMKGRKVLKLLIVAWKRRLTFTIGTSTTTGESDTVTWNEIHHKTEFGTNYSGHGYPDDKYLDNVLMELGVHGVTESDLSG